MELNTVRVPYHHADGSCFTNCGVSPDGGKGTWFPMWWGAGAKAGKWSGATGPQNVLFNNTLLKQVSPGGAFAAYGPYFKPDGSLCQTAFEFGWNGTDWSHLSKSGSFIDNWLGNETVDFTSRWECRRDDRQTEHGRILVPEELGAPRGVHETAFTRHVTHKRRAGGPPFLFAVNLMGRPRPTARPPGSACRWWSARTPREIENSGSGGPGRRRHSRPRRGPARCLPRRAQLRRASAQKRCCRTHRVRHARKGHALLNPLEGWVTRSIGRPRL